jgi:hypothetical protein
MVDEKLKCPFAKTIAVKVEGTHISGLHGPPRKFILEGHAGGRYYTEQLNAIGIGPLGTSDRLVLAWQMNRKWQYEPDIATSTSSEVEVRFTEESRGLTRVDLKHRQWDRMGPAGLAMRAEVDSTGGWGRTLE